jgi:hypothetical protein
LHDILNKFCQSRIFCRHVLFWRKTIFDRGGTYTHTHTHTLITSDFTIGGDELWVGGEKLFESGGIRGNNNNNYNRNYNNNNNNHLVHYYTLWQKNPQKVREQVDKSQ